MRATTRTVGRLALPIAVASRTRTLTVVGWHRIAKVGGGLSTSLTDFRDHLHAIEAWGARVLPLDEAVRLLAADALPERAVALTFDDGYASVVELGWPELRERGWPATLFVVTGYLDGRRVFPWDEDPTDPEVARLVDRQAVLDAAAGGLDIGSHTVTHAWLPALSPAELDGELTGSRGALEDLLGRPVTTLAYPTGGWNPVVRAAARRAGYRTAVTVELGRNRPGRDALALRRWFAADRVGDFRLQLAGAFGWARPIDRWQNRKEPSWRATPAERAQ